MTEAGLRSMGSWHFSGMIATLSVSCHHSTKVMRSRNVLVGVEVKMVGHTAFSYNSQEPSQIITYI